MAEKTALTKANDVARLRADIEETRASMGDTLNAIQERLSPERLKAQARESIREATIGRVEKMARKAGDRAGDAGRGMLDVARDNPVPLALIGIGAGWLLYNSRKRANNGAPRGYVPEERTALGYEGAYVSESGIPAGTHEASIAEKVSNRVSEVGETVKARASETAQHISEAASNVTHRVEDVAGSVAGSVRSTVSDGVHRAEETAETVGSRARSKYEETPWFGAAVAIALGAAAGLSIPATRREQDAFGEKRDELVNRAREMGREKLQAVRRVAEEVVEETREAVREHAREEGLAMEPPSRVGDTGLGI